MEDEEEQGGRIFFSNVGRSMELEDEIELTSVGIDIGSSTSHLAFSKIVLERLDTRYVVVERTLLHQSDVLLTPYKGDAIDADALGLFIKVQYAAGNLTPEQVDTGALILTGVAARRSNARAIGEALSVQSGKFVVVSAGDGLEATLAAYGSGAVARSGRQHQTVLNVDIGGGTSKLARATDGAIKEISALDIGARVVAFDAERRVTRIEEAGSYFATVAGVPLALGAKLSPDEAPRMTEVMADYLLAAMRGRPMLPEVEKLHRLPPFPALAAPDVVTVSGGVSEFLYSNESVAFSDLGPDLARSLLTRLAQWSPRLERPDEGIRATVIGASQYTVQVSGSTIFVRPLDLLPIRNIPVVTPDFVFPDEISPFGVAERMREALVRRDLFASETPVAICYDWHGSATWKRLDDFCRGVVAGLGPLLERHPLILIGNGDVGGLVGMHCLQDLQMRAVVSIDGISLDEFDFVDIGAMLEASGAVPVIIKSLVFPGNELGRR